MFKRFKVIGDSMVPTLKNGQQVIVEKLSYWFREPMVGEVVILKNSDNMNIIKRITKKDGNSYFVEGDNAKESADSRNFGFIQKKEILGKAVMLKLW